MKTPILIEGAKPFQIDRHSFCIDSPEDAVTLQISVAYDGKGDPGDFSWYDYSDEIPANGGPIEVSGVAAGLWWRIEGNTKNLLCRF